jgi:adenosine deaminase CECR1
LTKWEHLWQWGSIDDDNALPKYLFSRNKPEKIDEIEWRLVSDIRREIGDDVYDKKIRRFFTMIVDDPIVSYNDINVAWEKFMDLFKVFGSIVEYKEVWRDYYRQSLQELYDDNVQYLELRSVFPDLYDLDGIKYGPLEVAQIYVDVLKEFKSSHPDFVGSKLIYAPVRGINDETFNTYLPIMRKLKKNFPNFIAGFDLVGQEDKGSSC